MRAAFDSSIFVSAFMFPGGRAEPAVVAAAEGNVELIISRPIIHEVLDVLARKFDRDAEQLARVAVYLADLATVVRPRRRISVLNVEPDNRVLGCAAAGRADVIVTGDQATLRQREYKGVRIISLKEFLDG